MIFDWTDFFKLGKNLHQDSTKSKIRDAVLRTVISRCYYSAFCNAREFLIKKENINFEKDKNVHWEVINKFRNHKNKIRKEIGYNLDRLIHSRQSADYDNIFYEKLEKETKFLIYRTEEVLNNLSKL